MSKNLAFDTSSSRQVDENGYLHVSASHITKATVNPYYGYEIPGNEELGLDPEKIYYGLRDPDELKKSLPTWKGLPLHLEHHTDSAEAPQKEFRVGTLGTEINWNKPYIDAPLTIWDQDAIDKINNGSFRELSCAYRYDPDFDSPGYYEGEKYDFVMRNIRGNHVALVEEGRAGHDVLVADNKPQSLKSNAVNGMEHKNMAIKAKSKAFKGAKDGDPAIEKKEMEIAEQTKELMDDLQELHEEKGGEVIDKTEEVTDGNEVIDALKTKYNITDEDMTALLESLKGGATDEETAAAEDADETSEEDQANDEDETAAEDSDCDKAQDEEPEKKPDTTAQDRQLLKQKFDMAVDAKVAQIEKRIQANYKARANAVVKVRPLIGNLDPFAFDSANDIYKYALNKKGVSTAKYQPSAYAGMVDVLLMQQNHPLKPQTFAEDSAADSDEHFKFLKNIRIGD